MELPLEKLPGRFRAKGLLAKSCSAPSSISCHCGVPLVTVVTVGVRLPVLLLVTKGELPSEVLLEATDTGGVGKVVVARFNVPLPVAFGGMGFFGVKLYVFASTNSFN